jgi:site-specific DNA-cytosine methylase
MKALKELSEGEMKTKYNLILASPPCKSFSRAPDDPKGWDSADGELFKYCCTIIRKQQRKGHKPRVLFENVIIHNKREKDAITQEEYLGIKFRELTATACGGTQHRNRRIATNICDVSKIRKKTEQTQTGCSHQLQQQNSGQCHASWRAEHAQRHQSQ